MYYYIGSFNRQQINILRKSDECEYNLINHTNTRLLELLRNNRRFDPLNRAYQKISKINTQILMKSAEVNEDNVMDAISEYLFSFRKFLDNTEAYITRFYGKSSSQYTSFKKSTNQAYDTHVEYGMLYQLRNVDQHCDSIVSNIVLGVDEEGARYIKVISKSKRLLEIFSNWKKRELVYLQGQDDIDLFFCINVVHKCAIQIHQNVVNFHLIDELFDDCACVINRANEFFDKRMSLVFYHQENEMTREFWLQPKKVLNSTSWMVDKCVDLIVLFLKNNNHIAIFLFLGDSPPIWINECGIIINEKNAIEVGKIISINSIKYTCYSVQYQIDRNQVLAVAIKHDLPRKQHPEISKRFMKFANVLSGTRIE